VALAGLDRLQREHVQEPSAGLGGGPNPSAPQSNAFTGAGGAGGVGRVAGGSFEGATSGREASQIVHFSFALSGFSKSQRPHFHVWAEAVGGFKLVSVQLNPFMAFAGIDLMSKVGREDTDATRAAWRVSWELGLAE